MPQTPWPDQRTPALAIVARGDQIESASPTRFVVRSQSRPDRAYSVEVVRDRWSCECAHHLATGGPCIHILAVRFQNELRASTAPPQPETPSCGRCKSHNIVCNGKRHNASGTLARYLCRTCGFRFAGRDGYQKRRGDPAKIALALDLYFRGLSFRNVADHFLQVHGLDLSPMTVYRWVVRYSRLAAQWMDEQQARVGQRWHVDETVVNVDGQQRYLWNVMDGETRFLLATHVSRARGMEDTRAPLKKAKRATPDRPMEVRTDGMNAYPAAVGAEFGHVGGPGSTGWVNPHRRVPSIRARESNNRIERLHGTEKERTKVMRAFDNDQGAAALSEGFRVHYNLVRPHQALGTTPGEAARLPVLDGFQWKALLEKAVTRKVTPAPEGPASPV
ncbi:MAG: IS6 family transposase [Methanobacteriota archaeon]